MWLIIDLGGGYIKYGASTFDQPISVPNCTAHRKGLGLGSHLFVGLDAEPALAKLDDTELAQLDLSFLGNLAYIRPMERGYLTNIDCQEEILAKIFSNLRGFDVGALVGVLVTVAPFTPASLTSELTAIIGKLFRSVAIKVHQPASLVATLVTYKFDSPFCVVVDCGYSFTHVSPVVGGQVLQNCVKRLDIGGKLLTNYLKEIVSYGSINLTDDNLVVEYLKRDLCYVSMNIKEDLNEVSRLKEHRTLPPSKRMSNKEYLVLDQKYTKRYVLPDFVDVKRGYLLSTSTNPEDIAHLQRQTLTLREECFLVPEVIFSPSVLNIQQAGLTELIESVVESCPEEIRHPLRSRIVVIGGSTLFPNFSERLAQDLGSQYKVVSMNPNDSVWLGGKIVAGKEA